MLFKNEPSSYNYNNVNIICPVTLKLTNFDHSGCTVFNNNRNIRLYSKSVVADEELKKRKFKPIIETVESSNNYEKVTIYRLKDPRKCIQETILFMYIKHLGLPIYQSSFDAYAFMIVLMADKSFYQGVIKDNNLYNFWKNMWLYEEFNIVQERLLNIHDRVDPVTKVENVIKILSSLGLRCDMIQYGWNQIQGWC